MTDTLYKVLKPDGSCYHGGRGKWPLPNGKPGAWVAAKGPLRPCANGIHLCRRGDLVHWLGPAIFVAEKDGEEVIDHGDKIVVRAGRLIERVETWNDVTARLFAADCAEEVLPIFYKLRPDDDRPQKAIEAARAYARGEITDAARAAAEAAAWDAAGAAAWDAAGAAAGAAARAAAGARQTALLFDYLEGRKVA